MFRGSAFPLASASVSTRYTCVEEVRLAISLRVSIPGRGRLVTLDANPAEIFDEAGHLEVNRQPYRVFVIFSLFITVSQLHVGTCLGKKGVSWCASKCTF